MIGRNQMISEISIGLIPNQDGQDEFKENMDEIGITDIAAGAKFIF